jgi:hypothetical protein
MIIDWPFHNTSTNRLSLSSVGRPPDYLDNFALWDSDGLSIGSHGSDSDDWSFQEKAFAGEHTMILEVDVEPVYGQKVRFVWYF